MDEREARDKIIVALDVPTVKEALAIVGDLAIEVGSFKLGLQTITAGIAHLLARRIMLKGGKVGWDGKWDDIPATVGKAAAEAAQFNPWQGQFGAAKKPHGFDWANVHASSSQASIEAAVANRGTTKIYGVTVLTSMSPEECVSIFGADPTTKVLQFAHMIKGAGAQGIICSPLELPALVECSDLCDLDLVTPGIRMVGAPPDDQNRTLPPGEAIRMGATRLVIGRPITQAPNRRDAVARIVDDIIQATA